MMFLEILTRTFDRRPTMLARNQASLAALVSHDWTQTLIVDAQGRGVNWANMNLATVEAQGNYVWVLDDDDLCARTTLVNELRDRAPFDVALLRAEHADFGRLPHDVNWQRAPVWGDIGFSNFVVRRAVWNAHRAKFATWDEYAADFRFIEHLWRQHLDIIWLDIVAASYPQRSQGAPEHAS